MTTLFKYIGCIIFSLIAIVTDAQEQSIRGKIKDRYGKGIPNTLVLLSDTTQISHHKAEFIDILETDSIGNFFIIENVSFNKIVVNRIGYKPIELPVNPFTKHIEVVLIENDDSKLEEVTVKGYRQAVKMNTSGLEYDMKYSPVKQGSTMDALRFVPLIHIDRENVGMIGKKGVKYYLNGKELKLSGSALSTYIQSLSVNDIEKIELITSYNPRFNIGFNQGGINIITKQNTDEGWKGNVQAKIWKTHYWKGSGNLHLSYKKNKLSSDIFFSSSHLSTWRENETDTQYKEQNQSTESKSVYDGKDTNFSFQGLFDYSIDPKSKLSGNANIEYFKGKQTEYGSMSYLWKNSNVSYAEIMHDNVLSSDKVKINAGITFQHLFDKNNLFRSSVNYYYGNVESSILARMDSISSNGVIGNCHEHYKETILQKSSVWSGDALYTLPLGEKTFLALEFNAYNWKINNNDQYWTATSNGWDVNELSSHHLEMEEWNFNGTISMQNNWNKKIRSVIGMGIRKRDYQSKELDTHAINEQEFWQPNPFLAFSANASKSFNLNYSADYQLSNPSFSQMNTFKWYNSATTYYIGNPNLSQTKKFNQNLTIQFLQNFIFSVGHEYSDDIIVNYNILKENEMIETRPENMASNHSGTVYFSMNNISYIKGKGNFSISLGGTREWYNALLPENGGSYKHVSDSYFVQFNNAATLFPAWEIQMINSLSYNSSRKYNFTKNPASINIFTSFQKNIKNWNFNLNFSVHSFMYGSKMNLKWEKITENPNLYIHTSNKGEAISCALQISYRWGNKNVKTIKRSRSSSRNLEGRLD